MVCLRTILNQLNLSSNVSWPVSNAGGQGVAQVRAPNEYKFYGQNAETIDHLLLRDYIFSREVWFKAFHCYSWHLQTLVADDRLGPWWLRSRKTVPKVHRKAYDSLCFLIEWSIWLECNSRVFRNGARLLDMLCASILELAKLWCKTRLLSRSELFGRVGWGFDAHCKYVKLFCFSLNITRAIHSLEKKPVL
jgi:hypothetical protein